MIDQLTDTLIAFGPLILCLALFRLAELFAPFEKAQAPYAYRLLLSTTLYLTASILTVNLLPAQSQAAALALQWQISADFFAQMPLAVSFIITFLVTDLAVYFSHRLFHQVPVLWRIHRAHHSDTSYDTSTALRFHPVEVLINTALTLGIIVVSGLPLICFIWAEGVLLVINFYVHSNIVTPRFLRPLSRLIVTPEYHKRHHSDAGQDQMTNYGTVLTIWDHLFGSANPLVQGFAPAAPAHITVGVGQPPERYNAIVPLLADPILPDSKTPPAPPTQQDQRD